MKLLFSEARADYAHYIFPYAIWAFPEAGETPGDLFDQGFLPSSRNLDRYYLCRQVRVNLAKFKPSSENDSTPIKAPLIRILWYIAERYSSSLVTSVVICVKPYMFPGTD